MDKIDYRENAIWTVYLHTNKVNGKYYVGITSRSVDDRWRNGSGYHGQIFYRAIKKYGWDSFEHEIIAEHLTESEASDMEKMLIKKLNSIQNGYNISPGGLHQPQIETRGVYQFDIHGNLIAEYNSIVEASEKLNIPSSNIICTCNEKVNHAGKYIWRYKDSISDINSFKNSIDISLYDTLEPVYQFDMEQNFIAEYESAIEASKNSPDWYQSSILDCCRGNYKYSAGYVWKFKKDVPDVNKFKNIKIDFSKKQYRGQPVCQYDLNGNLIKEYLSTRDAAEALNCDTHTITYACSGRTKTGKGYIWKYKNNNEIKSKPKKKVLQFDFQGNFIQEYPDVLEVSKITGNAVSSIISACNGSNKSCGGYLWKYKDEYHGEKLIYKTNEHIANPVLQFSLNGDFVCRFDNVNDAAKAVNRSQSSLGAACIGRQKSCAGFKWMYEKDYVNDENNAAG